MEAVLRALMTRGTAVAVHQEAQVVAGPRAILVMVVMAVQVANLVQMVPVVVAVGEPVQMVELRLPVEEEEV